MTEELTSPAVAPHANGATPRMAPRHFWLDVPGYPTYQVHGWTNAPRRVFLDLDSADGPRMESAIRALIVGTRTVVDDTTWDCWFDCDGEPLPAPDAADFVAAVPTELLAMALRAIRVDGGLALGNSLRRGSGRSASG